MGRKVKVVYEELDEGWTAEVENKKRWSKEKKRLSDGNLTALLVKTDKIVKRMLEG